MNQRLAQWWDRLRIQHKVWAVLLLLCVPLAGGLLTHLYFIEQLLQIQQQRHQLLLAQEQVHVLHQFVVDAEESVRSYAVTQQPMFLQTLVEAEVNAEQAVSSAATALAGLSAPVIVFAPVEQQVRAVLDSTRAWTTDVQQGRIDKAVHEAWSGEDLRVSVRLRQDLGTIEGRLAAQRGVINTRAEVLSRYAYLGLWTALGGIVVLGWAGSRVLARSLTNPIQQLRTAAAYLGDGGVFERTAELVAPAARSRDEIGQLAQSYLEMARRIEGQVQELEALNAIGQEINTIGPDGLEGVLRRITDRAVEMVQADVCLVLLRNDRMGCWVVEAASGEWNDRLKQSVMLWEELPVSVQAFQTGEVAIGERFRQDARPQVVRRNFIGDSMIAIPLLAQGVPFGVLSLLSERPRPAGAWNQRIAKGLAQEAALAISNARLYESVQAKQQGLLGRLRHLEHLAETLAHDLKGPGARMEELAALVAQKLAGEADARTAKWLALLQENGQDLVRRVEGMLEVARVGVEPGALMAVDPRIVIDEVLKARAGEIEQRQAIIRVAPGLPLVACHPAYLRQIFDNVLANALKYARPGEPPVVELAASTTRQTVCFSVRDEGIGIPGEQRERVFQPFVRLRRVDVPGSGIGLAIVQRIVELYGGHVWIETPEGGGCEVKFTLPWINLESDELARPVGEESTS